MAGSKQVSRLDRHLNDKQELKDKLLNFHLLFSEQEQTAHRSEVIYK